MLSEEKIDFKILDSLRGMAALYVCIAHARGLLWIGGNHYLQLHPVEQWSIYEYLVMGLNLLTRLSTKFVILFFVLSGFSIAHSLSRSYDTKIFYLKRFIRLYPPYLAAIGWAAVVLLIIMHSSPEYFDKTYDTPVFNRLYSSRDFFLPITLLKDLIYWPEVGGILNPFWSLVYEVIFYAMAPFVLRKLNYYTGVSLLLFLAGRFFDYGENVFMKFMFEYNMFFVFGVLFYTYRIEILSFFGKRSKYFLLASIAMLYVVMVWFSVRENVVTKIFFPIAFSYLLIIYFLVFKIKINFLGQIGKFSYTLYITHFASLFLYMWMVFEFTSLEPPYLYNNLIFIPAVFLSLGLAYVQYRLVERKTQDWLARFRR